MGGKETEKKAGMRGVRIPVFDIACLKDRQLWFKILKKSLIFITRIDGGMNIIYYYT